MTKNLVKPESFKFVNQVENDFTDFNQTWYNWHDNNNRIITIKLVY